MVPNKTTLSSGATRAPDHWLQIQKFPQPLSFSNSLEDSQNSGKHHTGSTVFWGKDTNQAWSNEEMLWASRGRVSNVLLRAVSCGTPLSASMYFQLRELH